MDLILQISSAGTILSPPPGSWYFVHCSSQSSQTVSCSAPCFFLALTSPCPTRLWTCTCVHKHTLSTLALNSLWSIAKQILSNISVAFQMMTYQVVYLHFNREASGGKASFTTTQHAPTTIPHTHTLTECFTCCTLTCHLQVPTVELLLKKLRSTLHLGEKVRSDM